ncbi:MAG: ThiF family adenylyltransferase [Candidatus Poseidoniaceae archaeon]|nr:ThiF family adenylyltransferase [Candidatus Poseidoniaceae archaeon]
MNERKNVKNVLIIGAGGIGTTLVDLLVPALERIQLNTNITLMDGDVVETTNLGHQRFSQENVGIHKVNALFNRYSEITEYVELTAVNENLRNAEQLENYDFVVVCVDRPEPRRLVHSLDVPWIDLRCSADGWMILSSDSDAALVEQMTPDHEPMSCQVKGALDAGNLEFGFSVAGTFGAQWLVQKLRERRGPVQSIGSLTYGSFEFPQIKKNSLEVKA